MADALVQQFINPVVQALSASGEKLAVQFSVPFYGLQLQMNFSLVPDPASTSTVAAGTAVPGDVAGSASASPSPAVAGVSQSSLSNGFATARRF